MVAHLLECHAIISDQDSEYILNFVEDDAMPEQIIQFNDNSNEYMTETYEQEVELVNQNDADDSNQMSNTEGLTMQELHSSRMSGVWNYFEPDVTGTKVYCILCKEIKLAHSYSCTSSTSNLRKHLKSFHSISVDNFKRVKVEKKEKVKKKSSVSKVWKYFSKKLGSSAEEKKLDFVYCVKCLENNVQQKYRRSSSTGTLKAHLRAVHNIDLNEINPMDDDDESHQNETINETQAGQSTDTLQEELQVREIKSNKRLSSARPFFQSQPDDKEYLYCILCLNENHIHKYKTTTSTTSMKAHLIQRHQVDPDVESLEVEEETLNSDPKVLQPSFDILDVPVNVCEAAKRIILVKSRKVRTYFMKLEGNGDEVFCAYCLAHNVKKGYKPRTSTSGLRRHLATAHHFDPLKLFQNNQVDDEDLDEEAFNDSIRNLNKNRASEVWRYFSQKEIEEPDGTFRLDTDHIYCTLCWNAPIREYQKYAISTSSGSLRRHLLSRHELLLPTVHKNLQKMHWNNQEVEETIEEEEDDAADYDICNGGEEVVDHDAALSEQPVIIQPVRSKQEKYCRACGRTDAGFFTKLTALFDDADDEIIDETTSNLTLGDLYWELTGIKVNANTGMSQLICYMCEANLKSSFKFKKIALETEKLMYNRLQDELANEVDYEVYVAPESVSRNKRKLNEYDPLSDVSKNIKVETIDENCQRTEIVDVNIQSPPLKLQKIKPEKKVISSGSSLLIKQPPSNAKPLNVVRRKIVQLVQEFEKGSAKPTKQDSSTSSFQLIKLPPKSDDKLGYNSATLIEEFSSEDDLTFASSVTGVVEKVGNLINSETATTITSAFSSLTPSVVTQYDIEDYGSSIVKFVSNRSPIVFDTDHDSIVVSNNKAVEKLLDGNLISATSSRV